MTDRRERNHQWYESFDEKRMVIVLYNDTEVPAKYEVCGTCDGKGSHVNPAIDSQGLTREDFDEDPDFRENYFSGMYDVQCVECHGARVVPEISDYCPPEIRKIAETTRQEHYDCEMAYEAERRMGA